MGRTEIIKISLHNDCPIVCKPIQWEGRDPARYEFDSRFTPPSLPPVKLTQSLTRSYADPKTEILNCRGVTPRVTETDVKVSPSRIPWNNAALKLPRNLQLLNARYTGFQYFPPVTVIASLPRRPDHRQTPTNYQAFRPWGRRD